jgi:hypothetical protein
MVNRNHDIITTVIPEWIKLLNERVNETWLGLNFASSLDVTKLTLAYDSHTERANSGNRFMLPTTYTHFIASEKGKLKKYYDCECRVVMPIN